MNEQEYRRIEAEAKAAEGASKFAVAARHFAEIGQLGHAVRCYLAAQDNDGALRTILRIPKDDGLYRDACVLAIRLAVTLDRVDFDFDQFVGRFLATSPANDGELDAFYAVGVLFERQGFVESSREVFQRIHAVVPAYRDVASKVERVSRPSFAQLQKIVEEDESFRHADRPSSHSMRTSIAPERSERDKKEETFPSLPEMPQPPQVRSSASGSRKPLSVPPRRGSRDMETLATSSSASSLPPRDSRVTPIPSSHGRPSPVPADLSGPASASNDWRGSARFRPIPDLFAIPSGFVVADRYRIESLIGRGGMAVVYKAHDLELEETIAIKLFAHGLSDQTLLSRFKQELALCRQITHPNVIRLYDIGSHNDVRFITMELLSGDDLCDLLEKGRDQLRDLGYLIQLCDGLQAVHDKGVVHRDLKPENIFVTRDGVVKLMDFGIAKRRTTEGGITMEGFSAGTPAYMAPEQINSFASVTHLSDLYSLGVIAYRIFTDRLPFESEMAMAVLVKQLNEAPAPPSTHEPTIPDELEYIILQLMEKDPKRRIQSCAELARDLRDLRSRLESSKRRANRR